VVGEECEEDGSSFKWQQQNPASWNQDSNSVWSSTEECNNACIHIHILMDSNNNILNNMPVINSMLCMSPLM
jgi:hypothetical protein